MQTYTIKLNVILPSSIHLSYKAHWVTWNTFLFLFKLKYHPFTV